VELKNYSKDEDRQHEVIGIEQGSIAMELGIKVGDRLVSINGKVVNDALDYHLFVKEEVIDLVMYMKDHDEAWQFELEKDEEEDLGLIFDNNLMDEFRSCRNKCVFCFIDQLPKGMRETLYFKDDDARLSFLQGNYITLTNMTEREVSRIVEYHLSPINISVHTMNLELRQEMLVSRFANRIVAYMDRLHEAGITMNGQVVLCKGLNDGEELSYTIEQLEKYVPQMQSMSVVPVGLSKHREGLYELEAYSKEECQEVLAMIHKWQKHFMETYGTHFVHAGDEFYIMAGMDLPKEDNYDGYLQLENGVGMTRLLIDSFESQIEAVEPCQIEPKKITIATGVLIESILRGLIQKLMDKVDGLNVTVVGITNDYFGPSITVSGLLVGEDITKQLEVLDLGEKVYIPDNILRTGEAVLLDDMTQETLEQLIDAEVHLVNYLGETFIEDLMADLGEEV